MQCKIKVFVSYSWRLLILGPLHLAWHTWQCPWFSCEQCMRRCQGSWRWDWTWWWGCRVRLKSPSRVREGDIGVAGREQCLLTRGNWLALQANQYFVTYLAPQYLTVCAPLRLTTFMVYCPLCFIHYLCYVPKHVRVEGKVISRDVKMALQQNITNQSARISWNKYITLTMLFLNGFDTTAVITPYHSGGWNKFQHIRPNFFEAPASSLGLPWSMSMYDYLPW